MGSPAEREIADEVTRVHAITYLQGATGHGIGSLCFLALGGVGYWLTGWPAIGFGGLVCAFLLSANGFSIYLWDVIQEHVYSTNDDDADTEPTRTLSGPSLSVEHRAELIAGFAQVLALVVVLFVIVGAFQRLGIERGSYLLGTALAAGNLVALLASRLR